MLFLTFLFFSCKKDGQVPAGQGGQIPLPDIQLEEKIYINVPYGAHFQQQMDIYLPQGRSGTTILLILVHGGEWKSNDKDQMKGYIDNLRPRLRDFAIANINYRLVQNGNFLFPTQEEDVKTAIRFLSNMADSFRVAKKFVLIGESAGAQLALQNAFKSGHSLIRGAIGIGTPANIEEWYKNPPNPGIRNLLEEVIGGTASAFPDRYCNATVYKSVSSQSPPTLLIHGINDGVVPFSQAEALTQKLSDSSIKVKLIPVQHELHNFSAAGMTIVYNEITEALTDKVFFK